MTLFTRYSTIQKNDQLLFSHSTEKRQPVQFIGLPAKDIWEHIGWVLDAF